MRADVTQHLAHRIRALRKRQNITQESLSQRSKVSIKHIQALEGKTPYNTTVTTLQKLADGFEIPLWKLLKFDDKD